LFSVLIVARWLLLLLLLLLLPCQSLITHCPAQLTDTQHQLLAAPTALQPPPQHA
jgi:hypothetical protein